MSVISLEIISILSVRDTECIFLLHKMNGEAFTTVNRGGSRIFIWGGTKDYVRHSEGTHITSAKPEVRARLRALEALGVFYALSRAI